VAEKKMTNIRLDPDLWARVKAAAGERGTTLERWVSDALEAHMQPDPPGGAPPGGATPGGAPRDEAQSTVSSETQALHWRVAALEAAVDYLAGVVGGGFRRAGAHPADDPGTGFPHPDAGAHRTGGESGR
jgi:hypothetical protein